MTVYTIERVCSIKEISIAQLRFLDEIVPQANEMFGNSFNLKKVSYPRMLEKGVVFFCKRDGEVTGIMVSSLGRSAFDLETIIFTQQLFYVKPASGRTAYHLFKKFIDFGKENANHIISMITSQTNIKSSTLKRWGFKELETWYRMEV